MLQTFPFYVASCWRVFHLRVSFWPRHIMLCYDRYPWRETIKMCGSECFRSDHSCRHSICPPQRQGTKSDKSFDISISGHCKRLNKHQRMEFQLWERRQTVKWMKICQLNVFAHWLTCFEHCNVIQIIQSSNQPRRCLLYFNYKCFELSIKLMRTIF